MKKENLQQTIMVQCIPPQPYSRQHQHLSNLSYKRRFYLSILKVNNDEQLFATKGMQTEHVWFKTGKNNIWLLWFAYFDKTWRWCICFCQTNLLTMTMKHYFACLMKLGLYYQISKVKSFVKYQNDEYVS